jgi:hypothetical protein
MREEKRMICVGRWFGEMYRKLLNNWGWGERVRESERGR